jgi:hypothetical protein
MADEHLSEKYVSADTPINSLHNYGFRDKLAAGRDEPSEILDVWRLRYKINSKIKLTRYEKPDHGLSYQPAIR